MFFFLAKVLKNTILFREYSPHRRGGLKRRKVFRFFCLLICLGSAEESSLLFIFY